MKTSLQLRQSQQLTLTPQLQQSIKLLQMSTLELSQEIEQALADNPMLERSDDPLDDAVRIAPNGGLDSTSAATETGSERANDLSAPAQSGEQRSEATTDQAGEAYGGDWQAGGGRARGEGNDDDSDYPQLAGGGETLHQHLMSQLSSTTVSDRDHALISLLIDEVNEDGYLGCTPDEVVQMLPEELDIDIDEVAAALSLLQSFDPPGVAGRDLRECLMLQLRTIDSDNLDEQAAQVVSLANDVVNNYLEILAAKDFNKLKRSLHCNEQALKQAQALIVSLSPRPGANFATDEPTYVVPDVLVQRASDGWAVSLNPNVMPKLRVNDMYADVLRRNRGVSADLSGQLQEARWLIKNIQQRFDTILRVSEAIVDRQKAFFSHGEVGMRPLVLREIADTLGLHESTVSRVTTHKYMLTPHGTFELKYFFGSHVATDSGGAASSTAIRALIKQLIAAEDSKKPLSDNSIAQLLAEQGFVVARRTVAKYREVLRIPPVSQRKTL